MVTNGLEHEGPPIAVFDSGLGGLTVARALRQHLPGEPLVYFGDTARLPYSTKSPATVHRFTRQCLRFMMTLSPKLIVVACNTASALALEQLVDEFDVPVIGVLEPGAAAAVQAARLKGKPGARIGLIATEATINSNAYPQAVRRLDPAIHVIGRACPLLVPMIEEGRDEADAIVTMVLAEYLQPFIEMKVAAMILGCTHYPILRNAVAARLGPDVELIDSADQTALVVKERLATMHALGSRSSGGSLTCYVTDQGQRFERLAGRFLGQSVGQPIGVTPEMLEEEPSRH
jgi:glutamate racemase